MKKKIFDDGNQSMYETENEDELLLKFSDDLVDNRGHVKASVKNKGAVAARLAVHLYKVMASYHFPVRFKSQKSEKELIVKKAELFPFYCAVTSNEDEETTAPQLDYVLIEESGKRTVEAHELMSELIRREVPTITFSKAKMTAEMIHRYVTENLQRTAPALAGKVTPYRGGYLPAERREIERRLFSGELLGVSCTRALELGIDVGGLDAAILVGYPGTRASFFQQSGRAGRQDREALVVLVGLDTAINQYIMSHPEYIFGHPVEEAVIDPDNPFVVTQHLRCACHELPLAEPEIAGFGPYARLVLEVLAGQHKLRQERGRWYYAAPEIPQHEISLRDYADRNVVIVDTGNGAGLLVTVNGQPQGVLGGRGQICTRAWGPTGEIAVPSLAPTPTPEASTG